MTEILPASGAANSRPAPLPRVLHVINGEHYSGAERVQDLLAMALPEQGYELAFACVKPGSFRQRRQSQSTELVDVPMRSRIDWTASRRLAKAFVDLDCRALHAHTPRSLLVASGAARILDCPLIYHIHSPVGKDSKRVLANRLNTWSEKRSLKRAARLICVSDSLRQYMRGWGHTDATLRVVHNGVPPADLSASLDRVKPFWNIGMVALFRPRKGFEILLEAMAILARDNLPVRLQCIGPFESIKYHEAVFNLADQLNIAHLLEWVGFTSDVSARLRQLQILALPSLFGEGLPMVMLEAMAVGLPVVASKVEGVPEAIRDGVDGLLCAPGNSAELASQIRQLVANRSLWQELSYAGWQRQRDTFSDRSMAAGVAAVYNELGLGSTLPATNLT